ncbi:MAG: energy transducer TonB [Candidatus Zixiibacteriota bacterium]
MLSFISIIVVSILSLISITPSSFAGETEKDDSTLAAEKQEKSKQKEAKVKADSIDCPEYSSPGPDEFVACEKQPEMISRQHPEYPRAAKEAGLTGKVWIKCLVNVDGKVLCVQVGKSTGHPELDQAAVNAAWKNRFKPAIQNGRPVRMWVTYPVEFTLTR